MKDKKILALILKLDLKKAYNRVNWAFLMLVLLQIGLGLSITNWVMSCVTSVSFAVFINGSASKFLKASRGLRKGCPLSPLLFLLIMEALSLLIK